MATSLDSRIDFIHLASHVIECLDLPRPAMAATEGDALEIALCIDGAQVSLCHEPDINSGHFLVNARMGCIGTQPGAAQRLLVENAALLEHGSLTLGSHAETSEVSYFALLEVAAARADGVADCVRALAQRARWLREGSQAVASSSVSSSESKLRPAVALSDRDWRAKFDEQIRDLCESMATEPSKESATSPGGRSVTLAIDGGAVLLTHRSPTDAFYTARGAGDALSADVEETVARRLLQTNAELAHEGMIAFALTPDFRHVIWRVTSPLPGPEIDELVSRIRWAADIATCVDSDRPPALSQVHMLA